MDRSQAHWELSVDSAGCQELSAQLADRNVPTRSSSGDLVLGADVTTFKIGGPLQFLIEPRTAQEAVATFQSLRTLGREFRVLGEGSNLLIPDNGVAVPVVRPRGRNLIVLPDGRVEVEAGYPLMSLSRQMSDAGLGGLEFAGGIPGSLGGAAFMNAGAHGSCIGEVIEWVEISTADGTERISAASLPWRYRHSGLSEILSVRPGAITRVGLRLIPTDKNVTAERRAHHLAERRARQPLQAASAGSVFRNPSAEQSAGAVIERCGLKGSVIGGALVSPLHANWIINPKREATARDVSTLIRRVKTEVQAQTGILLHEEIVEW